MFFMYSRRKYAAEKDLNECNISHFANIEMTFNFLTPHPGNARNYNAKAIIDVFGMRRIPRLIISSLHIAHFFILIRNFKQAKITPLNDSTWKSIWKFFRSS